MMRINWIFSAVYNPPPEIDLERIKSIGPTWSSWRSWRSCQSDNVICHDMTQCKILLNRAFQAVCNFYLPRAYYQDLGRPLGVKLYDGDYKAELDNLEDIVAMHLVADSSDIVLMCGFDLAKPEITDDRYDKHKMVNRHGLLYQTIQSNPKVQWVLVDHDRKLDKAYENLDNLTCDTMDNALQLLI
jgi:hypothetical protein